jgi:hypothetical protein
MIRHTSAAPAAAVANPRNVRRQYLTSHLCKCGPRCVLEALIAVEAGQDLDFVLADFARLAPQTYRSIGADRLPFKTGLSDDFLAGRYGKVEAATGAIT